MRWLGYGFVLLWLTGCQLVPQRTVWRNASDAVSRSITLRVESDSSEEQRLVHAQEVFAEGVEWEEQGDSRCVDRYFEAAANTWAFRLHDLNLDDATQIEACELHESALIKMLTSAQEFGRWNQIAGLSIQSSQGNVHVPVQYRGFVWRPEDFDTMIPVGPYSSTTLARRYGNEGVGVPMVVVRDRPPGQPFVRPQTAFAATAVLKPVDGIPVPTAISAGLSDKAPPLILELSDPLRRQSTEIGGQALPLASDHTAPIAFQLANAPRTWFANFVRTDTETDRHGLFMLEPYQRDKIPVVFIHGLLSDPFTWAEMLNELRARPEISERYQIWAFEYPTGQPFLASAAKLRTQLKLLRQTIDPGQTDTALSQIVLVGHSMGGLLAKLQITQSQDVLWRTVSNQSLHAIHASHETRARLAESFYFEPSLDVSRVVFIGTPHHGSTDSQRAAGRIAAALVQPDSGQQTLHDQLIQDNPGVFADELADRVPTSIDLLRPDSKLLEGVYLLPIRSGVALHSIIGDGRWSVGTGPGDGVVPVSSAEHPGVASTAYVSTTHTSLTSNPEVIDELVRILIDHQRACGAICLGQLPSANIHPSR